MQATMDNFKRKQDDYSSEPPAKVSVKYKDDKQKFYVPNPYDQVQLEIVAGEDWQKNVVPMLKRTDQEDIKEARLSTPLMNVQWAWVGKLGEMSNPSLPSPSEDKAQCTLGVTADIDPTILKRQPQAKDDAEKFFAWMQDITDQMYEFAWNHPDIWKTEKDAAKTAAKKKKETRNAKEIFISGAANSWWKPIRANEDDMHIVFKSKLYQNRRVKDDDGYPTDIRELHCTRPQIWKKTKVGSVKDISDNLDADKPGQKRRTGLRTGSSVRFGFQITAYSNQSGTYGIKCDLGRHVLCVKEKKYSGGTSDEAMVANDLYFSSDEDE